jgi:transcriptional regulator with XRE-family HTH domain
MRDFDTSAGERIRAAREHRGLPSQVVAAAAGIGDDWYRDVENDATEATSNLSLTSFGCIARAVGLSPLEALAGRSARPASVQRSLSDLASLAHARMEGDGLTIEAYSQRVGWDMAPVFADPAHVRRYTADALWDICADVGVDWREVLADATAPAV